MTTCTKDVADHTGFHFHKCGKPAKRYFINAKGGKTYRCGMHSRTHSWDRTEWIDVDQEVLKP